MVQKMESNLLNNESNNCTYISLFSSAGIGCYGFKEQEFKCIATNEYLEKRIKIQKSNNKCKFDSGYILMIYLKKKYRIRYIKS